MFGRRQKDQEEQGESKESLVFRRDHNCYGSAYNDIILAPRAAYTYLQPLMHAYRKGRLSLSRIPITLRACRA